MENLSTHINNGVLEALMIARRGRNISNFSGSDKAVFFGILPCQKLSLVMLTLELVVGLRETVRVL